MKINHLLIAASLITCLFACTSSHERQILEFKTIQVSENPDHRIELSIIEHNKSCLLVQQTFIDQKMNEKKWMISNEKLILMSEMPPPIILDNESQNDIKISEQIQQMKIAKEVSEIKKLLSPETLEACS